MSVENFKPTLWEGALLANFHSLSIADVMATQPTDIKGNKVKFNRVASGTLKDSIWVRLNGMTSTQLQ